MHSGINAARSHPCAPSGSLTGLPSTPRPTPTRGGATQVASNAWRDVLHDFGNEDVEDDVAGTNEPTGGTPSEPASCFAFCDDEQGDGFPKCQVAV